MAVLKHTVSFDLRVQVEERQDYWAARTDPFAITMYGDTGEQAEKRALEAALLLLKKHDAQLADFLTKHRVHHLVTVEDMPHGVGRTPIVTRESINEVRLEVAAGAV